MPEPAGAAAAAAAPLVGGVALLERAVGYALGELAGLARAELAAPTPCAGWDLAALLRHLTDSVSAMHEAAYSGRVELDTGELHTDPDPVAGLRDRIRALLGVWSSVAWAGAAAPGAMVSVAGRPLHGGILTATGALEIAMHGWDVSRARGRHAPVPAPLAEELLELAPLLVVPGYRSGRFAAPVPVPPGAAPADLLVAFLGRSPR
jgi:uncharacterized protein (TIGR03086 family)